MTYTTDQIAKAQAAVTAIGHVVRITEDTCVVLGSDGCTPYVATAFSCNCPAGRNGRACYHRAAVEIATSEPFQPAPSRRDPFDLLPQVDD